MKKRTTRLLIAAVVAALLVGGLLYLAQQPSNGPNIFTMVLLPFYLIGVLFSGNVHQSSNMAYVSMYLFFFVCVYVALFIWSKATRSHDG